MNERLVDSIVLYTIIIICFLVVLLEDFETLHIPITFIVIGLVALGILINKHIKII